jgi:hypothetical protein
MCLACELDAIWDAEWERLAAAGNTGVLAAVSEDSAGAESDESRDEGETPLPGSTAVSRMRFRCEETE